MNSIVRIELLDACIIIEINVYYCTNNYNLSIMKFNQCLGQSTINYISVKEVCRKMAVICGRG